MFTVSAEYRFATPVEGNEGHESCYIEGTREFRDWNDVKVGTTAFLNAHEYADEVFFTINKVTGVNAGYGELVVGFRRNKESAAKWDRQEGWYATCSCMGAKDHSRNRRDGICS